MEHHFNIEVAKVYGVVEATIIHNFYFWLKKNEANKKHFYDGMYWTYNSTKAMAELFPYLTEKQISYALDKLAKMGALHKGNYNANKYDRTLWYALDKSVISILQKKEMEMPIQENGVAENVEPIPDSKTDRKINSKISDVGAACENEILVDDFLLAKHYKQLTKKEFKALVFYYEKNYPAEILQHFYHRWSQTAESGAMLFQEQKAWDIVHRINNWIKKEKEILERDKNNNHATHFKAPNGNAKLGTSAARAQASAAYLTRGTS